MALIIAFIDKATSGDGWGQAPPSYFYWGSLKNGVFSTFFGAKVPGPYWVEGARPLLGCWEKNYFDEGAWPHPSPSVVEKSSDGLGGI